jgi:cytochrome c556
MDRAGVIAAKIQHQLNQRNFMKNLFPAILIAASAALALPAHAQFAKSEDAIKYRQSAFTLLGNHMGRINAQLKAGAPNVGAIQASAALIETVAPLPFEGFGAGTEGGKAKAEIWKDGAKFKAADEKLRGEITKLNAAAKTGDVKAIQTQFGNVGAACKGCHDEFRAK